MRVQLALRCVAAVLLPLAANADTNHTARFSRHMLPSNFKPPMVFENVDLIRDINVEKGFPRERVTVIIKNIGTKPEDAYYVPFEVSKIANVGGFKAVDKNDRSKGRYASDVVEYDPHSDTQFYRIKLTPPIQPNAEQTLVFSYFSFDAVHPLPAKIEQADKQYLSYTFNAYMPSCYTTTKQKTKLKVASDNIPDITTLPGSSKDGVKSENKEDPVKQGKVLTYGTFSSVPAGVLEPVNVRFEHTYPITHVSLLERDIEVSHWGGNLATEERYWVENRAAALANHFSRTMWMQAAYYNPINSALKGFIVPLPPGSSAPYFIDDIGNVSTSRWSPGRSADSERAVDLKPRYPIFGDWRYKFRIGWDVDLKSAVRVLTEGGGERYILKVPFLEGPQSVAITEGIQYGKVVVRVILPEGSKITSYATDIPGLVSASSGLHRTFMDTRGRTTLTLTAHNLADELRGADRHALYVAYEVPATAGLRKPLSIAVAVFAVFAVAWAVGLADVRIAAKGRSAKTA